MRKIFLTLGIFSMIGLLTACGGGGSSNNANPSTPAPANQGTATPAPSNNTATASGAEATFKQTCAVCHGADLQGNVGPNLTKIGSKYSKDQILAIITNGKNAMPPGLLKGADADAVATWLAAKK